MQDFVVMFDLDGTLLNTDLLIHQSFEHVFQKYKPGYVLSEEEHFSFLGPTLSHTFSRYFPSEMVEELIDYYREFNHEHHQDYVTVYPTVIETLQELKKRGFHLAVVTTKLSDAAYIGLDLFDIRKEFDMIIGCDHVEDVKPSPEGIHKVMAQTKCSQGLYIGDNVTDILAGKNAGVYTVGVKWTPKGTLEMEKLNPDFMIDEMIELVDIVERVNKNV